MPAKKKAASKKKAAAAPKVKLNFALDAEKIEAIKKCLAKGKLSVAVQRTDLGARRVKGPWLYD